MADETSPTSSRNSVPPRAAFEHALAILHGTGEGAASVTKEFALEQGLGKGATIHGHERTACASRSLMNPLRQALLADATLACDEHGGVDRGDARGQRQQLPHGRAPHSGPVGVRLIRIRESGRGG